MTAQVTVGLDGSEENVAAARWAVREAVLREVPVRLVYVDEWPTAPEVPVSYARTRAGRRRARTRSGPSSPGRPLRESRRGFR
ncbi:universal stress protein [Streptomyces vietnamensis]|uniref:UspA domain-containing protein n=1 Tax=Streptomyces vietnamensis TaxID=362257 RepID=A0A0B5HXV4_9ACTN|nr:universal stress protein [Streptomyces vietnamensis]AJF63177.1 hypothetical protein SVTN_00025 [Streptomyces vietnamensis]